MSHRHSTDADMFSSSSSTLIHPRKSRVLFYTFMYENKKKEESIKVFIDDRNK